jgi:two-component system cell cycle response regulator
MKFINDSHGHQAGDLALKTTADLLRHIFRESDILSRYGGDEFIVLILDGMENPEIIGSRIYKGLEHHVLDFDNAPRLSLSFGISIYDPESGKSLNDLISEADAKMYEHKKDRHR